MSFGTELKKMREQRGRKQAYFAYQLGISQSTYWKIENDKATIQSDALYSLLSNKEFTEKEQLILAEEYQEKVDEEWVEPKPKPKKKKKKKRVKSKRKKEKIEITDEQRAEYRRKKSEKYFKEHKPKKSTNKEIKRARSMSAIQKVFY